ncbi:DUF47 domain-containing protein [Arcanobacterium canis]|uniref:DUF47 family protein n=1 Tax=Arcanobacterium canis TaxID=999183 RepID=A0ABY8G1R2_9ACTO|nr:DUF47 family protein [Arcanobacterium canis]WFM83581.1 DUF47 family protein [Arcanobacterium canis]
MRLSHKDSVLDLVGAQSKHLGRATKVLTELAHANRADRESLYTRLHAVENDADAASHKVIQTINRSFVLPFDREDLFNLTSLIDDCVDMIDEAGGNMVLYKVEELPPDALKLIDILQKCADVTMTLLSKLEKIDEHMRAYWVEINQLENHGDTVYRKLISDLFADDDANMMAVMRMKFVVERLEGAIDRFENLAAVVETIAIKES